MSPTPSEEHRPDAPAARAEAASYVVVVPAKSPRIGKSRLGVLPDEQRTALARAVALDTVEAVLATPAVAAVLAVTDDAWFARELADLGAAVIPDGVSDDLNAVLEQAAAEVHRRWPALRPAVVCADLPAVRPDELDLVLGDVPDEVCAFVADSSGTGTTVYVGTHHRFAPRFGAGSSAAHAASGAVEVGGDRPSVRQDLDEVGDLGRVLALGPGPRTRQVLDAVLGYAG